MIYQLCCDDDEKCLTENDAQETQETQNTSLSDSRISKKKGARWTFDVGRAREGAANFFIVCSRSDNQRVDSGQMFRSEKSATSD